MLWEDTFVDIDQRVRVMGAPTITNANPQNAERLFLNRDIISLVKRFCRDMSFTIFYRFTKKEIVKKSFVKCGFATNVQLTYQGSDLWERIIVPLLTPEDNHHLIIICNEKQLAEIKGTKTFKELLNDYANTKVHHILPYFYGPSWGHFAKYTKDTASADERAYMFSASVPSLSNYFSYILNTPAKVQFLHKSIISNDQSEALQRCKPNRTKDLYLINYYRSSADSLTQEDFSKHLVSQIKNGSTANTISLFFCESIISYINKSSIDLNHCMFLIYPSSGENRWNDVLLESMRITLQKHGCESNTLKGLRRIITVPKQHTTSQRDSATQLNSIEIDINDLALYQYAVVIDDFVSKGTSFNSAITLLRRCGFQGFIQTFAVGGTQYKSEISISYKLPFDIDKREIAQNGYIFDLDNTIMETDNALQYRESRNWDEAYKVIPEMKPYYYIIHSIKQLIKQNIDVAIVTSSPAEYCKRILRFIGISLNDVVCVCYHDTRKYKPDPDPFLVAEKLMKHNNINIFCVGDQENDIIASDNANRADPAHTFIPLFAYWQSKSWWVKKDHTYNLEVFNHELQFVQFLGFIIPAKNTLENLIDSFIRPVFYDKPIENKDIYELLENKEYLIQSRPGTYVPTEKGKSCGFKGSYTSSGSKSNILCNQNAQYELLALLCKRFSLG